jgi:GPH family glycoside/pentoside/hexuronide:cation symporter
MENVDESNRPYNIELLKLGRKVPTNEKLSIGIVQMAIVMLSTVIGIYLFRYNVNIIGLKLEYYILANFIFLFWNTLNDLIYGIYADRTKHQLGRRIPYIRYGAILVAITFIFFWFPLPGTAPGIVTTGQIMKFVQLLIALFAYDTVITIIGMSFNALVLELTESQEERTSISLYQNIFNAIGGMGIILVPFLFNLGLEIFRIFIIILGITAATLYFLSSYLLKERKSLHQTSDYDKSSNILKELFKMFGNKAFLISLLFSVSIWFSQGIMTQYASVMGYVLKKDGFELVILGIYYACTYPFYIVLHYLAKKYEIGKIIIRISIMCFTAISALFIIDLIFNISILYLIVIGISGILFSFVLYDFVIFSNVIDLEETRSRKRKEAQYSASKAIISIPLGQLVGIIGGLILMAFHYQEGVDSYLGQPDSAIIGIKLLIVVFPIICFLIIILTQAFNPLKGKNLVKMKVKLMKIHEEKEEKYKTD